MEPAEGPQERGPGDPGQHRVLRRGSLDADRCGRASDARQSGGISAQRSTHFIANTVRLAIDLQVRLRYATTSEVKQARQLAGGRQQRAARRAAAGQPPSAYLLRELHESAQTALTSARTAIAAGKSGEARSQLAALEATISSATDLSDEVTSEATMFRVLASIGLEHAAFVHEVRSLALAAQTLADTLERLAGEETDGSDARQLRAVATDAQRDPGKTAPQCDLSGRCDGHRGSAPPQSSGVARSDRSRRWFFEQSIERQGIAVHVDVAEDVQTPPLFPAELTAILSNILSNAIKFAGKGGRVGISAKELDDVLSIRMRTVDLVDMSTAERWFDRSARQRPVFMKFLGQGMGFGFDDHPKPSGRIRRNGSLRAAVGWLCNRH